MATTIDHPHFEQEDAHLKRTIAAIEDYIELHTPVRGEAADQKTAHQVWNIQAKLVQNAQDALNSLYFGRVDWQPTLDGRREAFYIGTVPFLGGNGEPQIVAWQDTLAGDLYYQLKTAREAGELLRKRTLVIEDQTLQQITDEYVTDAIRDEAPELARSADQSDQYLLELLRQTRDGRLHTVVATLRSRQHQLITASENQILVVEGPPGSGKTEIALHRISYLLYQGRLGSARQTKRILALGPNRLFVNYAAGVLQELGERDISQRAFDEWMYELLDSSFEFEPQHLSLEMLLDPSVSAPMKAMRYRNAVHKSSLAMARLLDNYVNLLTSEVLSGKGDLTVHAITPRGERIEAYLSTDQIGRELNSRRIAALPFNQRRDALEEQLVAVLYRDLLATYERKAGRASDSASKLIRTQVIGGVHGYFDNWRSLNVSVAYRRLLRNPRLLRAAGNGIFSEWDLELLMQDAPTAQTPFRYSDLPSLLYLKILLEGLPGSLYDHIVVDEAQDVTPLQFQLLTRFCPQKNMTIMGDMKQGIFAHHGVRDWPELFGASAYNLQQIPNSYRSTRQVNEYANKLLRRVGFADDQLIDSVSRDGPEPVLQRGYTTLHDWARGTVGVVTRAVAEGWKTTAIIGKSLASCRRIAQTLAGEGLDTARLITNAETDTLSGIVVIPLHLAKGLEFDVVVLADVDAQTYPADLLHARLLYVGITRAAHQLVVNWVGEMSPLLDDSAPTVALAEPFAGVLEPAPVTIIDFAARHPPLDPASCVERLARTEKLHLMENGRIDETVLAALLKPDGRGAQVTARRFVQPLDVETRGIITEGVRSLQVNPENQSGLALTQLAYGLLRNQLRFSGLRLDTEADTSLEDQVVALVTFQRFLDGGSADLPPGRWTTERSVLELVAKHRVEQALRFLNLLVDYGIVERNNEQIRLRSELVPEMLTCALGRRPASWDPDLIGRLSMPVHLHTI